MLAPLSKWLGASRHDSEDEHSLAPPHRLPSLNQQVVAQPPLWAATERPMYPQTINSRPSAHYGPPPHTYAYAYPATHSVARQVTQPPPSYFVQRNQKLPSSPVTSKQGMGRSPVAPDPASMTQSMMVSSFDSRVHSNVVLMPRIQAVPRQHHSLSITTAHPATPAPAASMRRERPAVLAVEAAEMRRHGVPPLEPSVRDVVAFDSPPVAVKPSSLLENRANETEGESLVMKKAALQRLARLKRFITSLEKSVESEFDDLTALDITVTQSELILSDVSQNLTTTSNLIKTREDQLRDAEQRFRLLTAEDLTNCSAENLEDISDVLWSGLQSATLALSRKQDQLVSSGLKDSDEEEQIRPTSSSNVPEATFVPPALPVLGELTGKSDGVNNQLSELLQTLKEIQGRVTKQIKSQAETADNLHAKIVSTNSLYASERESLLTLERKLDTRLGQVNRLTGRDSCASLSVLQLSELCKTINKASRKLATEQAIRQVKAQQQDSTRGLPKTDGNCMVCFERTPDTILHPCAHELCGECSSRLNFCPNCRVSIESRSPKTPRESPQSEATEVPQDSSPE